MVRYTPLLRCWSGSKSKAHNTLAPFLSQRNTGEHYSETRGT